MLGRRLALSLSLNAACADDERPAYAVDATLYVESHCEALCEKNRDCEQPFYETAEQCRGTCLESTMIEMNDEDGCFEFQLEYNRCRFDLLSCEEIWDDNVGGQPGTPCQDEYEAWQECPRGT